MPEHEAREPDPGAESLTNRVEEIRNVELRLVCDLQGCIDATNKLLERIGKTPGGQTDGSRGKVIL